MGTSCTPPNMVVKTPVSTTMGASCTPPNMVVRTPVSTVMHTTQYGGGHQYQPLWERHVHHPIWWRGRQYQPSCTPPNMVERSTTMGALCTPPNMVVRSPHVTIMINHYEVYCVPTIMVLRAPLGI